MAMVSKKISDKECCVKFDDIQRRAKELRDE